MPTRDERKAAAASNLALMRGAFSKDTQETIDAAIDVYKRQQTNTSAPIATALSTRSCKPTYSSPFRVR